MLYLASSIATSVVRLSGRSASSRSRRVLAFHCAISVVVFFFLADFPLSTGRSGRAARSLVNRATAGPVWRFMQLYIS